MEISTSCWDEILDERRDAVKHLGKEGALFLFQHQPPPLKRALLSLESQLLQGTWALFCNHQIRMLAHLHVHMPKSCSLFKVQLTCKAAQEV